MKDLGGLLLSVIITSLLTGINVRWWGEMKIGYSIALLIPLGFAIAMLSLSIKQNLKRRKIEPKPGA